MPTDRTSDEAGAGNGRDRRDEEGRGEAGSTGARADPAPDRRSRPPRADRGSDPAADTPASVQERRRYEPVGRRRREIPHGSGSVDSRRSRDAGGRPPAERDAWSLLDGDLREHGDARPDSERESTGETAETNDDGSGDREGSRGDERAETDRSEVETEGESDVEEESDIEDESDVRVESDVDDESTVEDESDTAEETDVREESDDEGMDEPESSGRRPYLPVGADPETVHARFRRRSGRGRAPDPRAESDPRGARDERGPSSRSQLGAREPDDGSADRSAFDRDAGSPSPAPDVAPLGGGRGTGYREPERGRRPDRSAPYDRPARSEPSVPARADPSVPAQDDTGRSEMEGIGEERPDRRRSDGGPYDRWRLLDELESRVGPSDRGERSRSRRPPY